MEFNHFLMFLIFLSHQAFALDIYSQVSGSITNIKNIGDSVNTGDVVITIDNRQAQLKLKYMEVIGKIKQQAYDDAKLKLDQTKELYDRMVASHHDLDIAQIDFNAKDHELSAHKIKTEIQKIELEKYQIKSPISGVIKATPNARNITNINAPKILMVIE